jgi:hypothetical protein
MSSNPSFNAPVLSYVGSVDVASATSGSTLYNILFDASLCTIGNILMFEYKIQPSDISIPNPDNITLGYVNVENAIFNSGIQNQWTIAVPAINNIYNPSPENEISVRVYSGLTGQTEIAVSPWSNSLDVHTPPVQPIINRAFFYQNTLSSDDLWVNMLPTDNYDYDEVSFIVAYYFQDADSSTTTWSVSDPLQATSVTVGDTVLMQLEVANIGNVSTNSNVVYTAIYAVYPFEYSYDRYYSVSEISTTYTAEPANNFLAPTITTIDYLVYDTPSQVPGDQTMVVNWDPPAASGIPVYTVANYVLQISTDGDSWTTVSSTISSTTLSYDVDVSNYVCGDNLSFRVFAISTTGAESAYSNIEALNIFKYSLAPQNLTVTSSVPNNSNANIRITFENPTNIGCGDGYQYVINFNNEQTRYEPYNAATNQYTLLFTNIDVAPTGTITVYLETIDTNPPEPTYRAGQSAETSYIVSTLVLDPVDYLVYTAGTQNMVLTWNNPADVNPYDWEATNYDVYLDDQLLATVTDTTYTYFATESCGTNLSFYIVANLTSIPSGVAFTLESNIESINIFKYATAPTSVIVNWASTDLSNSIIDLAVNFTVANPYNAGCGNILNWVVNVTNNDGTSILYTQNVPYVEGQTTYLVYVNNVDYIESGRVYVFMKTQDTNSDNEEDGASGFSSFISASLPIYNSVTITPSRDQLTFNVLTQQPLAHIARFIWSTYDVVSGITRHQLPFITNNNPPATGLTVIETVLPNGVFQYAYTVTPSFFGDPTIPLHLVISVANDVGISLNNVSN